jgi:uncharacterized protein
MSLYEVSVPVFTRTLKSLSAILKKAEQHAADRKIDPSVLLNARLFPDMFPLKRQVQIASDSARRGCGQLASVEVPAMADTEETFEQLQTRITRTIDFLGTLTPAQFAGAETRTIELPTPNGPMKLAATSFLTGYAMANFSFHVVTAYNILRHNGVVLGKRDYLGAP